MNKILKKKVGIAAFSLIGGVALTCGAVAVNPAAAEGNAYQTAQIAMMEGASVRYYANSATTDESGIRFSAIIDSKQYEALEKMEESGTVKISYGMLIAPYSYFEDSAYGQFNEATVFGVNGVKKYTWDGDTTENVEACKEVAHVTYDELIASTQEGYEAYHEIKGSLIKIKQANLTKEFVGRGYIKYEYDGGVEYKFASYKDNAVENNVRSIVYVSQLAIDANDAASQWLNDNYVAEVTDMDTTYTVETYVGDECVKTEDVEAKINADVKDVAVAEYQGFNKVSAQTSGKVYANGNLVLKHVYEEDANYQVANGGFENGDLIGWTVTGDIGAVSNETHYWKNENGGYAFGLDGTYMFSCYAVSETDEKTGTLVSEPFTVGGSGWLTYKLGGMMRTPLTYVEIVDSTTGEIYKRYGNSNFTSDNQLGCTLNEYKANLSDLMEKTVYIRICDYSKSEYGVVFVDSFDALHFSEPKDIAEAKTVGFTNNKYELYNGDFSNGLDGWYEKGEIGDISTDENGWWEDGNGKFKNNGNYFSGYKPTDVEKNTGSLVSSVFEIGGSGWITYSIGAMRDPDKIYMEVIDALTGERYGYFYNELIYQCELIKYKADLSDFIGKLVYINFVDNATEGYGLIFCDEIKTYYESEPVGEYNVAVNCVYNVMNGGFETGNLSGWTLVDGNEPGFLTDKDGYWTNPVRSFNKEAKDGKWVYTGLEVEGRGHIEGNMGTLRSNTFIVKPNSTFSFKFGGARWDGTHRTDVYICLVKADGTEVARYYNTDGSNDDNTRGCLVPYSKELNNAEAMSCYIEIRDYATSGWGLLAVDSFSITQNA